MATTTTTTVGPSQFGFDTEREELTTAHQVRQACRNSIHTAVTAGLAPGHLQANIIVLTSRYAIDFRLLCARNPVPCPLLAESTAPGRFDRLRSCVPGLSDDDLVDVNFDIRTDLPAYNVYRNGQLMKQGVSDITAEWDAHDHVAFLIGCSFSFETDLAAAGLMPRHVLQGQNVPMYRTKIPLCPAGIFRGGTYVVSMRPYPARDIERVRAITRPFNASHGEPIDWGWDAMARIGIADIDRPEWGDAPSSANGRLLGENSWGSEEEVPVFWGCGVTPQEAVMKAGSLLEGTVMAHAPGHMLVLDARDEDIKTESSSNIQEQR